MTQVASGSPLHSGLGSSQCVSCTIPRQHTDGKLCRPSGGPAVATAAPRMQLTPRHHPWLDTDRGLSSRSWRRVCVKDARPSRWLAPLERPRWPQHRPRVAPPAKPSRLAVESVELVGPAKRFGSCMARAEAWALQRGAECSPRGWNAGSTLKRPKPKPTHAHASMCIELPRHRRRAQRAE